MEYGIKTKGPHGLMFRSRIEAKWAWMFEFLGWKWDYEPFDLGGYIPDFLLTFDHGDRIHQCLVEVKSEMTLAGLQSHEEKIEACGFMDLSGLNPIDSDKDLIILGGSLILSGHQRDDVFSPGVICDGYAGTFDHIRMFSCRECGKISFCSCTGWFHCRVSGCYDGDHHLRALNQKEINLIRSYWAEACNRTQWKGAA